MYGQASKIFGATLAQHSFSVPCIKAPQGPQHSRLVLLLSSAISDKQATLFLGTGASTTAHMVGAQYLLSLLCVEPPCVNAGCVEWCRSREAAASDGQPLRMPVCSCFVLSVPVLMLCVLMVL